MNALACTALALAMLCIPGPPAAARLDNLLPRSGRQSAWRGRRPRTMVPAAAGALAGLLLAGPGGALAGGVVAATVRRRRARHTAATTAAATATELADALRRMTDELRAGAHPAAALEGVCADGPRARTVLAGAAAAARLGDGVPAALKREAEQRPAMAADLTRIAGAWALSERHGIPLADLLAGAHTDIAWRLQYGRRVHAQLAGPRATATVLTFLPVLGLILGQLLGADPVAVLRDGWLGQVLLVIGVGLTAAGVGWTEHILRAAVPR